MTGRLRRFELVRDTDVTGVSGTGVVASGVVWPDGRCAMRWHPTSGGPELQSTAFYESIHALQTIHGHNGATTVRWIDESEMSTLLVNGHQVRTPNATVTFQFLAELAGIPHADTITWRRGSDSDELELHGHIYPGDEIGVVDGDIFNVAHTASA